jgi:hypothetical protein
MAQAVRESGKEPDPVPSGGEIRIPSAGTWMGAGAGILIVLAAFAWSMI